MMHSQKMMIKQRVFPPNGAMGIADTALRESPLFERSAALKHPVLVIRPNDDPRHAFAGELLRSEGVFFFEEAAAAQTPDLERLRRASLVVVLSGCYDSSLVGWLQEYVRGGGRVLVFRPEPKMAEAFGLSVGRAVANAHVRIRKAHGFIDTPEDLLCPGHTSDVLSGPGESLAELLSTIYGETLGEAIIAQSIGEGRAVCLAYDPIETILTLRHGWADYDRPQGSAYLGPRSIWAFKGLESLYTKRVPIGDVHADAIRVLVFDLLSDLGTLPRLWHFPNAARSLLFLKGDGCGEQGVEKEIALAENYGAKMSFYRPRHSQYSGSLVRRWAERGHAIACEFDLFPATSHITAAAVTPKVIDHIRAIIDDHVKAFNEECGIDFQTVCFHGCQWIGLPQIEMIQEYGWSMVTSFISFFPEMQKQGYGIYTIPSFMPTRYYDEQAGLCKMIYAPAAWDESQSLGPEGERRYAGMTNAEYLAEFEQMMSESVERYHLPHIANFHPCYISMKDHPRYSGIAAEGFLATCQGLGVPCPSLEDWANFIQDRWSVRIENLIVSPQRTSVELTSSRGVRGLTVFLQGASAATQTNLDGRSLTVHTGIFEQRLQRYVLFGLDPGVKAELEIIS